MINFIIYEKNIEDRNYCEMVVLNFLGKREEKFKIFDYNNFDKKFYSRNIYILSSESMNKLLELAKEIRDRGEWCSQIIFISDFDDERNFKYEYFNNNLLILDYLNKGFNFKNCLKKSLYNAYKILNHEKTLNFVFNGEIYKIPYYSILYIEKSNNQNHCLIHTEDDSYVIKETINSLEKRLDPTYFMKTHRSCIVNVHSIKYYDYSLNTVGFNNKKIDMISREKRKILKSRLLDENVM